MVRLLVIDDHEVVRRGLAALFAGTEIEIVAEVSTPEVAVQQITHSQPDVVLLDVRMGDHGGLDLLIDIKDQFADSRVVMLSAYDNPTYVARSVALGAKDFVLKSQQRHVLLEAIRRAANGDEPAPTSLFQQIRTSMCRRREASTDDLPLTNRELQVLRHVALGLSNREIGSSLGISVETVKEHVQNILRKTNVGDRTQAAVWAVRRGLV
jgi:DNA-binding NarL/FixJ family response regulator